jgi:hypothetical protein
MRFVVDWELYMDVTTSDKARRFVEKLSNLTGIGFEIDRIERYAKGKITHKANLTSTAEGSTAADAMWATVKKANRIARTWAITAPDLEDADGGEIVGTAMPKTINVQGVESMEFRIANETRQPEREIPQAESVRAT